MKFNDELTKYMDFDGNFFLLSSQVCVFSDTSLSLHLSKYLRGIIDKVSNVCDVTITKDTAVIKPNYGGSNDGSIILSSNMKIGNGYRKVEHPIIYKYSRIEEPPIADFKHNNCTRSSKNARPWFASFASISGSFLFSNGDKHHRTLIVGGIIDKTGKFLKCTSFPLNTMKPISTVIDAYPDIFGCADNYDLVTVSSNECVLGSNVIVPIPETFDVVEPGDYAVYKFVMPAKVNGSGECHLIGKIV